GASQQNVPESATDQEKKTAVLSAMNTSLTRLNGISLSSLSHPKVSRLNVTLQRQSRLKLKRIFRNY
ncbi:MAG: hypothetical protein ACPGVI_06510, partial [Crocinitomicaceae bacterium]